jgi:hypothetical protein
MARLTPTTDTAIAANPTASRFSHLEEIPLLNASTGEQLGVCYREDGGLRTGELPISGIVYSIRPKKLKDTIAIERDMGGTQGMMDRVMEQTVRVLTKTVVKWDSQPNVTKSQLEDLFDEDFEHLMLVLATFRTAGRSGADPNSDN